MQSRSWSEVFARHNRNQAQKTQGAVDDINRLSFGQNWLFSAVWGTLLPDKVLLLELHQVYSAPRSNSTGVSDRTWSPEAPENDLAAALEIQLERRWEQTDWLW